MYKNLPDNQELAGNRDVLACSLALVEALDPGKHTSDAVAASNNHAVVVAAASSAGVALNIGVVGHVVEDLGCWDQCLGANHYQAAALVC